MVAPAFDLKEYQEKAIGTLEAIIQLCERENIRYFIAGGALIGAVRHQGFVPWDDDIDICVPRPDYERLLACAAQLPQPYEILHAGNDPDYIYPFAKAYDASTTVTEDFERPFTRGVWVDIFPLDGTFENRLLRKLHFALARKLIAVLTDQQQYYRPPRKALKRLRKRIKSSIYQRFSKHGVLRLLSRICSIRQYDEAAVVGPLIAKWGYRESAPRSFFEQYTYLPFGHLQVRAPAGADPWLRQVFGDYMTPPPEHARKPTHAIGYVNLQQPYRAQLALPASSVTSHSSSRAVERKPELVD